MRRHIAQVIPKAMLTVGRSNVSSVRSIFYVHMHTVTYSVTTIDLGTTNELARVGSPSRKQLYHLKRPTILFFFASGTISEQQT